MSNLLVFQSGGPTAVLNASLTGIIRAARDRFAAVYGSRRGLLGVTTGELRDLSTLSNDALVRLRQTPSAALGTSRFRPEDEQLGEIVKRLHDLAVTGVIAIGGNDTADTAARLEQCAGNLGYALQVIGIPKTIDNDLAVTDHSLGFPSAARCLATITRDAMIDSIATAALYPVKVIEVMGRNAGWLAASCSLGIQDGIPCPLTILPERPFDSSDALLERVQRRVDHDGFALVIVPETSRWTDGRPYGGAKPEYIDSFGHPYFASSGQAVVKLVAERLGSRVRLDRPGSYSRSAMDLASVIDMEEAERCGVEAVGAIANGESGKCVVIQRASSDPYAASLSLAPLAAIANVEWKLPEEMLAGPGEPPAAPFAEYALPLLGASFPQYEVIDW